MLDYCSVVYKNQEKTHLRRRKVSYILNEITSANGQYVDSFGGKSEANEAIAAGTAS